MNSFAKKNVIFFFFYIYSLTISSELTHPYIKKNPSDQVNG
jgi:hypothetical protein